MDNITDWAVAQFRGAYEGGEEPTPGPSRKAGRGGEVEAAETGGSPPRLRGGAGGGSSAFPITKDAIFAYCCAVLHDPVYREKYALNLKREFPRIPFYPDFAQWVAWGEQLLALHIGYEDVAPFALTRTDTPSPTRAEGTHPKPKLKSDPTAGTVIIDEDTLLSGIPRGMGLPARQPQRHRLGARPA